MRIPQLNQVVDIQKAVYKLRNNNSLIYVNYEIIQAARIQSGSAAFSKRSPKLILTMGLRS